MTKEERGRVLNLDIDRIREMLYKSLKGNKRMLRNIKGKDLNLKTLWEVS